LPVLCGCRTWSLAFRVELKMRVLENMVLRETFGDRTEVTGEWRKLHKEELSDLLLLTTHHYHHLANMQFGHLYTCSCLHIQQSLQWSLPVPSACRSVAFSIVGNLLRCVPSVCMLQTVSSAFLYSVHTGAWFSFLQSLSLFYKPTLLEC
jgi:hypothetical protein